jgi:hypothetical protein
MIFFAGIESLFPLLIFAALALLGKWLKKRAAREQADEFQNVPHGPQPQRQRESSAAPPPPRPRSKSWEEELRDLLEDRPAPPPVRREVPPPLIYVPQAPPALPEPVFTRTEESTIGASRLHQWSESDQGYEHASSIQARVAQRLEAASHMHTVAAKATRREESLVARRAIELIRNRENLRAAIVTNVILGPPRALEEERL